ncbi:hypothetical protein CROQUDRAFT_656109 [Cronartium quercuum f. sp. fusiforme G11]|uniref:Kinesin motor domain-containing protein n=1 Tax=Cronartium quercuum f. sp. fusiforme G11 TaxID=708437 RepID=A0A9P6NNH8_9BASI|nr:hypothetical protein CROQUDRAFT_656109 [Cronartium quercuum f. sp. fusiforme G11]
MPPGLSSDRLTASHFNSGLPTSGRTTPSGRSTPTIQPGRNTPSLVGQRASTPSGIPARNSVNSALNIRPASTSHTRRDTIGLASPLYHHHQSIATLSQSTSSLPSTQSSKIGLSSPASTPQQLSSSPHQSLFSPVLSDTFSNSSNTSSNSTTVQVVLRIRPTSFDSNVPTRFQRTVLSALNSTTVAIENAVQPNAGASSSTSGAQQAHKAVQRFTFDRVYSPDEGQQSIWASVEGLVARFLEGYNVTVLAYGQTSSGKSYTMGTDRLSAAELAEHDSTDDDDSTASARIGIIPRAVRTIFHRIRQSPTTAKQTTIKTSYVEIYNEDLIDLVAGSSSSASAPGQVTIREDKDGKIIWSGLKELKVTGAREVMEILERGSSVRQTNSTDMNAQSSRSHAIFSLSLTQRKSNSPSNGSGRRSRVASPTPGAGADSEWVTVTSKFHFVDLAGSERLKRTAAVGERVKEGISINSGLHALGNVISALGDPSKAKTTTHIPYRDSKLTRLLQDSLGGNAHTLMIACVSPTEYNLNETLNTVKYANRARNIKNRAEVNAIEAGWEDVEYLQSTVLKLRKELANLKAGGGGSGGGEMRTGLGAIDEEVDVRSSPRFLELQGHLSELQAKFAKTVADLAQAQNTLSQVDGPSVSQGDFEAMIQPVVEEYEKSITALESQLALTKAALVHAEGSMKEQEEKLSSEAAANEASANAIRELEARLGRLAEREATNETYIKDLEEKLRVVSEADESAAAVVVELRREVAKLKETEAKSETYIKDLEAKLSKDEGASAVLRARVEAAEAELVRKEELVEELELKYQALSSGLTEQDLGMADHQKELVKELEERDQKVHRLEAALKEFQEQRLLTPPESGTNLSHSEPDSVTELAAATPVPNPLADTSATQVEPTKPTSNSVHPISPRSFTPPATPAYLPSLVSSASSFPTPTSGAAPIDLRPQLTELQERHETTLGELEQVQTKYNNALKEVEDLSAQLEEAKLIQPTPTYRISRSPTDPNSHSFPNNNVLPVKGFGTPVNHHHSRQHSPAPEADVSDPLETLETLETLEDPAEAETRDNSRSCTPVRTLSLTGGVLTTSGHRPRRSVHLHNGPGTRYNLSRHSSCAGSVSGHEHPHARSLSLSLSQDLSLVQPQRGSLLVATHSPRSVSPRTAEPPERSYESLEKEVIQLQEVLKEREEEIRTLEHSIRLETELGSPSSKSKHVSLASTAAGSEGLRTEDEGAGARREESTGVVGVEAEEKAIKRLDDLMRSMAQKESAHLELIESLRDELGSRCRAHEELVKLSRDQVGNMSSEIEGLRGRLGEQDGMVAQLVDTEQVLLAKEEELEGMRERTESLKAELAQLADEYRAKEQELEQKLAELTASHEREMDALRSEMAARVQALEGEHGRAMAELERSKSEGSNESEKLKAMEEEIESLKSGHASQLANMRQEMESNQLQMTEDQTRAMEELQLAHEQQLEELRTEHEEILVASLTELDARRTRKFEASLAALEDEHEQELKLVKAQNGLDGKDGEQRSLVEEVKLRYERRIDELRIEHQSVLKAELEKVRAAARQPTEAETELQEALDALSTLDKALLESQDERERLMKELKSTMSARNSAEAEVGAIRAEREALVEEKERLVAAVAAAEARARAGGSGPSALRSDSPSLTMQRNPHLLMGNQNKAPPPTPPPTMPPPPLPTSLPGLPGAPAERTSNTSSQLSRTNSNSGRESPSTSVGTNSMAESISMDPRVLKKIEEQDNAIAKLSKQLSHCEADLKSNIDLVSNLESALNETERNLRKSRLQMNELAKERDKLQGMNDGLRQELERANAEVEHVRSDVMAEKVEFENRLGEERRAKESAKKLLESRMEEMQNSRMTRKSKFNCF